jgi:hypothetical protein
VAYSRESATTDPEQQSKIFKIQDTTRKKPFKANEDPKARLAKEHSNLGLRVRFERIGSCVQKLLKISKLVAVCLA